MSADILAFPEKTTVISMARQHERRWREKEGRRCSQEEALNKLADRLLEIGGMVEARRDLDLATEALAEVVGYCRSEANPCG